MRSKTFTLFIFLFSVWGGLAAQVTLTAENSTPSAGYTDTLYVGSPVAIDAPATGADLVWDYAHVESIEERIVELSNEEENASFPDARYGSPGDLRFQLFSAEAVFYVGADDSGVYEIGRVITDTSFPLTAITGNPADIFRFVGDTVAYAGRINTRQFPMTYLDTYGGTRIERSNLSLTVAAFGLDEAPVEAKRYHSEERTVVGYGHVIIPMEDGSPSPPIEVLQLEVNRSVVDSIFLYGQPAPAAILSAFGVSQGQTAGDRFYLFYTPGLASPVLDISVDFSNTVTGVIYRPRAADLVSGVRELSPVQLSVFPNPARPGQQLSITTEEPLNSSRLQLLNLNGQVIRELSVREEGPYRRTAALPADLSAGIYLLQAYDETGRPLGAQKLLVH